MLLALGHPIGASGTRILVTLINEMIKRDVKKGLATLYRWWNGNNVLKDKLFFNGTSIVNHPDYVSKVNEDNKFPIQIWCFSRTFIKFWHS